MVLLHAAVFVPIQLLLLVVWIVVLDMLMTLLFWGGDSGFRISG